MGLMYYQHECICYDLLKWGSAHLLSYDNPCFSCNIAIKNFLVSDTREIKFYDVRDRTVRMFTL